MRVHSTRLIWEEMEISVTPWAGMRIAKTVPAVILAGFLASMIRIKWLRCKWLEMAHQTMQQNKIKSRGRSDTGGYRGNIETTDIESCPKRNGKGKASVSEARLGRVKRRSYHFFLSLKMAPRVLYQFNSFPRSYILHSWSGREIKEVPSSTTCLHKYVRLHTDSGEKGSVGLDICSLVSLSETLTLKRPSAGRDGWIKELVRAAKMVMVSFCDGSGLWEWLFSLSHDSHRGKWCLIY